MTKQDIVRLAQDFSDSSPHNYVKAEDALSPELIGKRIFDKPIAGFAAADDPLFEKYKEDGIIGAHYMTPREWYPEGKTVVSLFFHFTEEVVESNAKDYERPSNLWLHGYKEGMDFIKLTLKYLVDTLAADGIGSVSPILDSRFRSIEGISEQDGFKSHSSNWSERHAAYAAGLGTFGLSKGIITRNGMAGRYGSVITAQRLEPDDRPYSGVYDYCNSCGACIKHCPVNAISLENGKEQLPCRNFLVEMKSIHGARGSCGKCQVKLPCTYQIPTTKA